MSIRGYLVAVVLLAFLGFTTSVVSDYGYVGFFRELLASSVGIQAFTDLVIALSLVLLWMRTDAKANGLPFGPYLAVTLVIGSVGPLAYLLHRELRLTRGPEGARRANPIR